MGILPAARLPALGLATRRSGRWGTSHPRDWLGDRGGAVVEAEVVREVSGAEEGEAYRVEEQEVRVEE